ncbi:two-component system sensor histidine kinase EvgS [Chromobacterium alkanivorans]|nr:ATP-binding protein [Chromobacterium alkanivorans]MCS3803508.1 two-component system sensor histidine kinase EvgS [Chromobacterium alkanivorans]MCS3817382.1 two-component system sensor histidine kinase EvgS [Chromobacterium alkanivorans]MCS3872874.1 two-component system sensor histidine kinase EvgS [Chromobacterium alkanivorans]
MASAAAQEQPSLYTTEEIAWIKSHPTIPYSIDPYWPLEYIENGHHKGLSCAYLKAIAKKSGLQFQLVKADNTQDMIGKLKGGQIYLATMGATQLIPKEYGIPLLNSQPYASTATIIITRAGAEGLFNPSQLERKTVAVKGGGGYEQYLRAHYPYLKLVLINDPVAALKAVADGKVFAAIGAEIVFRPVLQGRFPKTLQISGTMPEMFTGLNIKVARQYPELRSIIDKSLLQLSPSETDEIFDDWVADIDFGKPSMHQISRYYLPEILLVLSVLSVMVFLFMQARWAKRRAVASEEAKSKFLAMMSHEIRTPMNAILAAIELLQQTRQSRQQQELSLLASSSAHNLLELLDDVLDTAKLEARHLALEKLPTDLLELAKGISDSQRLSASRKGLDLTLSADGLENRLLLLDPMRMRQIMTNLLSNAIKFTDRGEVALLMQFNLQSEKSGKLLVTVRDTGVGIAKARQDKLFRAYSQAERSTSRRYGGSGLGLSICKQLIELMGGSILLESAEGKGTAVSFVLHVEVADPPVDEAPAPDTMPAALPRHRLLVVEDMAVNQQAIRRQLAQLGCAVTIAENGLAALQRLRQGEVYSMILMDCHLPGIDGYETARRIRALETERNLPFTPIIAISAITDLTHKSRCIASGMDGILSKPLSLQDLEDILRLWLMTEELAPPPALPASAPDLARLYSQSARQDLLQFRQAVADQQPEAMLHHVHRLKGGALTVGAEALTRLAANMEQALQAEGGRPDEAALLAWHQAFEQALTQWREETPESGA